MKRDVCCWSLWVHGHKVCRHKKQLSTTAPSFMQTHFLPLSGHVQPEMASHQSMWEGKAVPMEPLEWSWRKGWLRHERRSSVHKAFPARIRVVHLPMNPAAAAAAFPGPPETLGEFPLQLFSGSICVSHQPWMPQGMVPKNQQLGSFSTWTQEIYFGLAAPSASHRCSSGRMGEEKGTWGHQNPTKSVLQGNTHCSSWCWWKSNKEEELIPTLEKLINFAAHFHWIWANLSPYPLICCRGTGKVQGKNPHGYVLKGGKKFSG